MHDEHKTRSTLHSNYLEATNLFVFGFLKFQTLNMRVYLCLRLISLPKRQRKGGMWRKKNQPRLSSSFSSQSLLSLLFRLLLCFWWMTSCDSIHTWHRNCIRPSPANVHCGTLWQGLNILFSSRFTLCVISLAALICKMQQNFQEYCWQITFFWEIVICTLET